MYIHQFSYAVPINQSSVDSQIFDAASEEFARPCSSLWQRKHWKKKWKYKWSYAGGSDVPRLFCPIPTDLSLHLWFYFFFLADIPGKPPMYNSWRVLRLFSSPWLTPTLSCLSSTLTVATFFTSSAVTVCHRLSHRQCEHTSVCAKNNPSSFRTLNLN